MRQQQQYRWPSTNPSCNACDRYVMLHESHVAQFQLSSRWSLMGAQHHTTVGIDINKSQHHDFKSMLHGTCTTRPLSQAGLTIGNERIVRWCNITDLQSIRNESRFRIGSLFFPKLVLSLQKKAIRLNNQGKKMIAKDSSYLCCKKSRIGLSKR